MRKRNTTAIVVGIAAVLAGCLAAYLAKLPGGRLHSLTAVNTETAPRLARESPAAPRVGEPEHESFTTDDLSLSALDDENARLTEYLFGNGRVDISVLCAADLSRHDPKDVLVQLLRRLDSPYPKERSLTLKLATLVPSRELLPLFQKGMADSDAYVRTTAVRSLTAMGMHNPEIVVQINRLLRDDSDQTTRQVAAQFFRECPNLIDAEVASNLCRTLAAPSGKEMGYGRLSAAWALCLNPAGNEETVGVLREVYQRGRDGQGEDLAVALAAAGALARRGDQSASVEEDLLRNVNNRNQYVRASCIYGLASFGREQKVRQAVVRAVADCDPLTESDVCRAGGAFGQISQDDELARTCSSLLDRIIPSGSTNYGRLELAHALAQMGKVQGFRVLYEMATQGGDQIPPTTQIVALGRMRLISNQDFDYRPFAPSGQSVPQAATWKSFIEGNYK